MSTSIQNINLGIDTFSSDIQFQILLEAANKGAYEQLVCSCRQFATLAKEALDTRKKCGKPLKEQGQKLEFLRAREFLSRKNSRLEMIPKWLITEQKIIDQARRFGLIDGWSWNDLDKCKINDPDFVLQTLLDRPNLIPELAALQTHDPNLRGSFGIGPDEVVNQETISRMTDTQLKIWAFIYVTLMGIARDEPEKNPFREFFQRFSMQQSLDFIQKLVDIDPGVLNFFPFDTTNQLDIYKLAVLICKFPVCYQFLEIQGRWLEELALTVTRLRTMKQIPQHLMNDISFLLHAIQVDYRSLQHVDIELRDDPNFMRAACSINKNCLQYASEDIKSLLNF